MKTTITIWIAAALAAFLYALPAAAQNVSCYTEQGGAKVVAGSGCEHEYQSGATLDIQSGTTVTYASSQITTAIGNPGRTSFTICGDATTVNNNTVYYGPGITLTANIPFGQNCDITAAGSTTEATADAPIFTNQAVQVLGMLCRNQADQDASISYTLRTAAGATVPSVTCTIADGERDCVADVQTTTAIAAGATVAIAAASTADVGASKGFSCTVSVAY